MENFSLLDSKLSEETEVTEGGRDGRTQYEDLPYS